MEEIAMKWISFAAGALALAAFIGCQESDPPDRPPGPVESHTSNQNSNSGKGASDNQAASSGAPELMLISVSANDQRVNGVIDFNSVRSKIQAMPVAERRRYVLQNCFELYLAERSEKHKKLNNVRIYAMYIPDRDEYARGSYANVVTLGILDSTQDLVAAAKKTLEERAGKLEWKSDLMKDK
jgi:hypothetical protein